MSTNFSPMLSAVQPLGPEPLKPMLKWAGGKSWLVPTLAGIYAPYRNRRLVEPFCGGLSVALGLRPAEYLGNDNNPHLINFYRQVQAGSLEYWRDRHLPQNTEEAYNEFRGRFNDKIKRREAYTDDAAKVFWYLNAAGYNGLCRFNRDGLYNVPFGRRKRLRPMPDWIEYRRAMAGPGWQFKAGDFSNVDQGAGIGSIAQDFIYCDPPYDDGFTSYSPGGFTWDDQERLLYWLGLVAPEAPTLISNKATTRIIDLYQRHGFAVILLDAPRRIACNGDRKPVREVLAHRGISL